MVQTKVIKQLRTIVTKAIALGHHMLPQLQYSFLHTSLMLLQLQYSRRRMHVTIVTASYLSYAKTAKASIPSRATAATASYPQVVIQLQPHDPHFQIIATASYLSHPTTYVQQLQLHNSHMLQ